MSNDFGLVTWEQVEFSSYGAGSNQKRDEFIRLQSGSNVVRIITKPYQYIVHKWKEEGDKGYGDKVRCSMFHGSCPLCEQGDIPKPRWYIGVIDRKTQSAKILDMSSAIFQAIQKLNRQEAWGDPGTYDIDITVDKNAGATGYYTVMPMPKTALTDSDLEVKMNFDSEALKGRCTPPKPEEVVRIMGIIRKRKNKGSSQILEQEKVESQTDSVQETVSESSHTTDDGQYTFKPVNV